MPRILTNDELVRRGARISGGSQLSKIEQPEEAVPDTPLVAPPTIDAKPIADAVEGMTGAVRESLSVQLKAIETFLERKRPEAWKFDIIRDSRGRFESIIATAIEK